MITPAAEIGATTLIGPIASARYSDVSPTAVAVAAAKPSRKVRPSIAGAFVITTITAAANAPTNSIPATTTNTGTRRDCSPAPKSATPQNSAATTERTIADAAYLRKPRDIKTRWFPRRPRSCPRPR